MSESQVSCVEQEIAVMSMNDQPKLKKFIGFFQQPNSRIPDRMCYQIRVSKALTETEAKQIAPQDGLRVFNKIAWRITADYTEVDEIVNRARILGFEFPTAEDHKEYDSFGRTFCLIKK